jgi:hypothetical protein
VEVHTISEVLGGSSRKASVDNRHNKKISW